MKLSQPRPGCAACVRACRRAAKRGRAPSRALLHTCGTGHDSVRIVRTGGVPSLRSDLLYPLECHVTSRAPQQGAHARARRGTQQRRPTLMLLLPLLPLLQRAASARKSSAVEPPGGHGYLAVAAARRSAATTALEEATRPDIRPRSVTPPSPCSSRFRSRLSRPRCIARSDPLHLARCDSERASVQWRPETNPRLLINEDTATGLHPSRSSQSLPWQMQLTVYILSDAPGRLTSSFPSAVVAVRWPCFMGGIHSHLLLHALTSEPVPLSTWPSLLTTARPSLNAFWLLAVSASPRPRWPLAGASGRARCDFSHAARRPSRTHTASPLPR
jgi:hypothetical protein